MKEIAAAVGGFTAVCLIFACVSLISLSPIQMGLKYNHMTQYVDPEPVLEPGMYWVGPFTSLITFPRTVQTMIFEGIGKADANLMDGRTSDGMPLVLGTSFQYHIQPDKIYRLYHEYGTDYMRVYELRALHIITEMACEYSAYEFFNEKEKIAKAMQESMNRRFSKDLYASVFSFQINEDNLPGNFTNMVLTAAVTKQQISRQDKLKEAQVISLTTKRIVAQFQANVTIQGAMAKIANISNNARADAAVIESYVSAEIESYVKIQDRLKLNGDNLIDYMWYDSLAGGGVISGHEAGSETDIMVGVEPSLQFSMGGGYGSTPR